MKIWGLDQLAAELGYADYAAYLKSEHWNGFRNRILRKSPHCRVCGVPARAVHHLSYRRLGRESPADVTTVCVRCHDLLHAIHRESKIPLRQFQAVARRARKVLKENPQWQPSATPAPDHAPPPAPVTIPPGPPCDETLFARRDLLRKLLAADYPVGWICKRYRWDKIQVVSLVAWLKVYEMTPSERARLKHHDPLPIRK
jgi:hypothetical protein